MSDDGKNPIGIEISPTTNEDQGSISISLEIKWEDEPGRDRACAAVGRILADLTTPDSRQELLDNLLEAFQQALAKRP